MVLKGVVYRSAARPLLDIVELRKLAEKATRGKRYILPNTNGLNIGVDRWWVVITNRHDDALYEAAIDPDTVIALLDELEKYRER